MPEDKMDIDERLLDRDTYRKIKKMDKAALEWLLNDVFERGLKQGREDAVMESAAQADRLNEHTLDLRLLESDIRSIKGIGEKRIAEIMALIEKHLGI